MMKILLVCAGGLSTSILMKKVRKWAVENGEEIEIEAIGKGSYEEEWQKYDCILTGPQISYMNDEIASNVKIPVAGIPSIDYAMGNAEKVVALAHQITNK